MTMRDTTQAQAELARSHLLPSLSSRNDNDSQPEIRLDLAPDTLVPMPLLLPRDLSGPPFFPTLSPSLALCASFLLHPSVSLSDISADHA